MCAARPGATKHTGTVLTALHTWRLFLSIQPLPRRPQQVQYPAFPTTTIGSFPQVSLAELLQAF